MTENELKWRAINSVVAFLLFLLANLLNGLFVGLSLTVGVGPALAVGINALFVLGVANYLQTLSCRAVISLKDLE